MAQTSRSRYVPSLLPTRSFDEQLYDALRQSPWWMISVACHVLVFLIAGLLATETVVGVADAAVSVEAASLPDTPEEAEPVPQPQDVTRPEPQVAPDPLLVQPPDVADVVSRDVDLPDDGNLGDEGHAMGDLKGPSNNPWIGMGPGAGGAFGNRGGPRDQGRRSGGGPRAERAIDDALGWLAAHQSPDGSWEAAGFWRWCDGRPATPPPGETDLGKTIYDPGVTGLALLAFLGAGYTHRGQHPFARTVASGLRYLKRIQDAEGCFGPRTSGHAIYNHATAALAMVEAYGMTGSPIFRGSAQRALDFIGLARNPYFAWRYGVTPGDNDSSVTGWMMMALKSAEMINTAAERSGHERPLTYDTDAYQGIRAWLDKMTDPDYGRVGYVTRGSGPARPGHLVDRFPPEKSESLTAVGVLARVFIGDDPRTSDPIQKGTALMSRLLPAWNPSDGSIDMYYWYYGTLAMFQVGGPPWRAWNDAMKTAIVDHQRQDTDFCRFKGSWDPIGPWGEDGGRVYATALMAMCLEVYYRYDRVFGTR